MILAKSALAAILMALAAPALGAEPASGPAAVRARLKEAVEVTAELFAKGEGQAGGLKSGDAAFPRASHVKRYAKARTWARDIELRHRRPEPLDAETPPWPTAADAPALREALGAAEPAVRALAAQALATLDEPEDAPRIAALLTDDADAPPWLTRSLLSMPFRFTKEPDALDLSLWWRKTSVKDYAEESLRQMTGRDFGKTPFGPWWEKNKGARGCLWFWQQRFQHKTDSVKRDAFLDRSRSSAEAKPDDWAERARKFEKEMADRLGKAMREISDELRAMPPELEAKVRLLAADEHAGGADITEPRETFFAGPLDLRVTADRLLDLLDRKGLWPDVDWDGDNYNRLVERLALAADTLFKPEHVERLQAALKRERGSLWWSGRAAMAIGISRLLPAAAADRLDDAATRDGWLRAAIRTDDEVFVRGYVARELIRVGLSANWPFLRGQFFEEKDGNAIPDLRQSVLVELGKPPLTEAKRQALMDILLDKAFEPLWTRSNRRMGDDACRREAMLSVNAHAGKELITFQEYQALADGKTSAETLAKVLGKVRSLGAARP